MVKDDVRLSYLVEEMIARHVPLLTDLDLTQHLSNSPPLRPVVSRLDDDDDEVHVKVA